MYDHKGTTEGALEETGLSLASRRGAWNPAGAARVRARGLLGGPGDLVTTYQHPPTTLKDTPNTI